MTHLSPELMHTLTADRLAEAEYRRLLREHADRIVPAGHRRRGRHAAEEL